MQALPVVALATTSFTFDAESFVSHAMCFLVHEWDPEVLILVLFVAGKDMLMKGAGRDCTALFSILILVFGQMVHSCSLFEFVNVEYSHPSS